MDQIQEFCNQEIFSDARIRIMPDVHAGKGCVIGYTANLGEKVVPNLIGLDIGCGILVTKLGRIKLSYDKLDTSIRKNIPFGFERNKSANPEDFEDDFTGRLEECCRKLEIKFSDHLKGIGSLGGGNHFIEIAAGTDKEKWLLIHSGSRNFGLQVATWHQTKALRLCQKRGIEIPKHFAYLEENDRSDYFEDMKLAQQYAHLNRHEMCRRILRHLDIHEPSGQFETIHNYISFYDEIIRKGAVSAHENEKFIIPLNMRDGSLIAMGKGNAEWNYSAPHGAGRCMSRNQAKKHLDFDEFRKSMKKVWTSTVTRKTLDEAPRAYKPRNEILQYIGATADVIDTLKPLYNFKAE